MEDYDLRSLIEELKRKNTYDNRYLSSTSRVQEKIIGLSVVNKRELAIIHKAFKSLPEPKSECDLVKIEMLRLNDDFLKLLE